MAKGMFTQGMCLLTDGRTSIEDLQSALLADSVEIVKQSAAQEHWAFGGPSVLVPFRPEVNGYVAVDLVNQSWPDSMGDPQAEPMVFGAWSMGQFGPLAFPGGLARAQEHAWSWPAGRTAVAGHRGFIRLRLSYVFGGGDDAPLFPQDYDPLAELYFMSRLVMALLDAPGVICYFNPNGEVLRDGAGFREEWQQYAEQYIPLPLWTNVRFFNLNDKLSFMDTVGNGQLETRDVEAIFPQQTYDPSDVSNYLRNVTLYLHGLDRELKSGEAIDGPGETNLSWTTEAVDDGLVQPPRRVLRLYPKASRKAVQAAIAAIG